MLHLLGQGAMRHRIGQYGASILRGVGQADPGQPAVQIPCQQQGLSLRRQPFQQDLPFVLQPLHLCLDIREVERQIADQPQPMAAAPAACRQNLPGGGGCFDQRVAIEQKHRSPPPALRRRRKDRRPHLPGRPLHGLHSQKSSNCGHKSNQHQRKPKQPVQSESSLKVT